MGLQERYKVAKPLSPLITFPSNTLTIRFMDLINIQLEEIIISQRSTSQLIQLSLRYGQIIERESLSRYILLSEANKTDNSSNDLHKLSITQRLHNITTDCVSLTGTLVFAFCLIVCILVERTDGNDNLEEMVELMSSGTWEVGESTVLETGQIIR